MDSAAITTTTPVERQSAPPVIVQGEGDAQLVVREGGARRGRGRGRARSHGSGGRGGRGRGRGRGDRADADHGAPVDVLGEGTHGGAEPIDPETAHVTVPGDVVVVAPMSRRKQRKTGKDKPKHPKATLGENVTPAAVNTPIDLLIRAIRFNDRAQFDALLREHASLDLNTLSRDGDAALVEACRYARADMVHELVHVHRADVNVSSRNDADKRNAMRPLHAACMTLDAAVVNELLRVEDQVVDVTAIYDVATPATICVFFCVGNGYSQQQEDKALPLLETVLAYAKEKGTEQLAKLVSLETDKGNRLTHIAVMLANFGAIRILKTFDADFTVHSATGLSPLQLVEHNAFHRRSFAISRMDGKEKKSALKRPNKKKRNGSGASDGVSNGADAATTEPPVAAAEHQIKVNATPKRLDRDVENNCVMRTLMELVEITGIGPVFSRKGNEGIRSIHIKGLVLAHEGILPTISQVASLPDALKEKSVYLDGVMHCVTSLYTLSLKNENQFGKLWKQAFTSPVNAANSGATLDAPTFSTIVDALLSHRSLSRRVKVWTMIMVASLGLFARDTPFEGDDTPPLASLASTKLFVRIADAIYRSGVKMLFSIFDRTDIDEDESYDEEVEFHLFIALVEMLLQLFAPCARVIAGAEGKLANTFQAVALPIKKLWPLFMAGMENLDESFGSPQRFSLVLHVLQVTELLDCGLQKNEVTTLSTLFKVMKQHVKQEATKKKIVYETSKQVQLLQSVSEAFPMPPSFVERVASIKDKLDVLLRSDAKVLGLDLYALARVEDFIRLEHKVAYLEILSEEQSGSVHVTISRTSGANYVEFIMQQILSTNSRRMKGELDISLVNEPGVGAGVAREFFQIVQQSFFNPHPAALEVVANASDASAPPSHVSKIGAQWLSMARTRSPRNADSASSSNKEGLAAGKHAKKTPRGDISRFFPLFEHASDNNDVLRLTTRQLRATKAAIEAKQQDEHVHWTHKDLLTNEDEVKLLKQLYTCTGRLLGLAIRDQQPLDVNFPIAFWKFMLYEDVTWEEFCGANDVFLRSLQFVLDHDFDASPLEMWFDYTAKVAVVENETAAIDATSSTAVSMEIELQGGKGATQVNNKNKQKYVELRARQFFFGEEYEYYKKMREGLTDTIRKSDLRLFLPSELRRVVRGTREIDLSGLRDAVVYSRGVSESHEVVRNFWEVVEAFDQPLKEKLLTFWSGSALPPLFGFDSGFHSATTHSGCWYFDLEPKDKSSLCPTANTCDRRLMLPLYPSKEVLREKLLVALEHGAVGYDRM